MDWKSFNIVDSIDTFKEELLNKSQKETLLVLNYQLKNHGAIIADEVGTGKTRIACALIQHVSEKQKGRSVVVIPVGLIKQWQKEYSCFSKTEPIIIRNYKQLIDSYEDIVQTNKPVFISQTFRFPIIKKGAQEWKYLFLAIVLNIKKENSSFDEYRNFAKVKAESFIHNYENQKGTTEYYLIKWARYFISKNYLFHNQTIKTIYNNFNFNFGDEASYSANGQGKTIMVDDVIGKMLGLFNLVIVDEAHKSKGDNSTLSNILKFINIDSFRDNQRIVGMTATPIELHEDQWVQLLKRINVSDEKRDELKKIIKDYSKSFKSLVALKNINDSDLVDFSQKATAFEKNLGQYVSRRKKVIDPVYVEKVGVQNTKIHPHRLYKEELIKFKDLNKIDKKWVFLHECLSKASKGLSLKNKTDTSYSDESLTNELYNGIKRLDSYFSRGHTLKKIEIDKIFSNENKNKVNDKHKFQRAKLLAEKWIQNEQELYKHPKIRRAIELIEKYSDAEEKILVFGCFSAPIKLLEVCLNSRYILKSIKKGKIVRIPKGLFVDPELREIVEYESNQLRIEIPTEKQLQTNDNKYENKRKEVGDKVEVILRNLYGDEVEKREDDFFQKKKLITARTTDEILYFEKQNLDSTITEIINEIIADEKNIIENDVTADSNEESIFQDDEGRQAQFYSLDDKALSGSEYTMLLDGSTDFLRRSIIQTEFNRKSGFPRVLIAQSQVGKEGLNLHKACNTVLLFNADWNPGVIEQQVGRVDRLDSLWEEKKNSWIISGTPNNPPMIEIIELHFDGTYDQRQWEKLKQRKQTLLYHLYSNIDEENNWTSEEEDRIMKLMPDFSPNNILKYLKG